MAADESARLKLVFKQIDRDGDGKIDAKDVFQTMVALGRKVTQKNAEDLIWEVDNDGDGKVSMGDILVALQRVRSDTDGSEPDGLITTIEFLLFDPSLTGFITCEECMWILSRRFGTQCSESDLRKFVIDAAGASQKTISYVDFLRQVQARKMLFNMR